jgi:hypothetical protein
MAKFNSGYLRTVDVQKTFYETNSVAGADGKTAYMEPVGILPLNDQVYGTGSNTGASPAGTNNATNPTGASPSNINLDITKTEEGKLANKGTVVKDVNNGAPIVEVDTSQSVFNTAFGGASPSVPAFLTPGLNP